MEVYYINIEKEKTITIGIKQHFVECYVIFREKYGRTFPVHAETTVILY